MIGIIVKMLLSIGFGELTAVGFATRIGRYGGQLILSFVVGAALMFGGWYLTRLGGDWREQSIREAWAKKFAAVEKTGQELQIARDQLNQTIAQAVADAIAALPAPTQVKCEIPGAAKKLNRIK